MSFVKYRSKDKRVFKGLLGINTITPEVKFDSPLRKLHPANNIGKGIVTVVALGDVQITQ